MKYYAAIYFYALAVIAAAMASLNWNQIFYRTPSDIYLLVDYDFYFFPIALLSLLTGAVYSIMQWFKKPISNKTGLFHFGFIVTGLFFSPAFYRICFTLFLTGTPDTTTLATNAVSAFFMLMGPLCLLVGLFIFIYGFIKAFKTKSSASAQP